jgi:hypothetical protein
MNENHNEGGEKIHMPKHYKLIIKNEPSKVIIYVINLYKNNILN